MESEFQGNVVLNNDAVRCDWCYDQLLEDLERGLLEDNAGYFHMGRTPLPCELCNYPLTPHE